MTDAGTLIVGGGPAAQAAAGAFRAAGGEGRLTILAAEPSLPYRRPPLSKELLRGEIEPAEVELEPPAWYAERRVEVVRGAPVVALDLEAGVASGEDGRDHRFDRALLATGARPALPDIPGIEGVGTLRLRTLADCERLARAVGDGTRALVVGSGFIGCEAASSLARRGATVTLVTDEEQPQRQRLGEEASARIAAWLAEDGVRIEAGSALARLERLPSGETRASLADGGEHEADAVLLALGVERNDELASAAGIECDEGVPVDAAMVSTDPRLLAAGDVALAENEAAGRRLRVEHWGEALAMGEVAGRTLAGAAATWANAPGFWSTIGQRTLKYVGWGEGFEETSFEPGEDGAFVVRYGRGGELVGVLAHGDDAAYESGREAVEARAPWR